MAEEERQDLLSELDLLADHHRLPPFPPAADLRPGGVVEDLVRFRQKPGHVAPAAVLIFIMQAKQKRTNITTSYHIVLHGGSV